MRRIHVLGLAALVFLLVAGMDVLLVRAQGNFDCSTATDLPQVECEALVALYEATGGEDWNTRTGWLQTSTPCDWYGVTCEAERVVQLGLRDNNLALWDFAWKGHIWG